MQSSVWFRLMYLYPIHNESLLEYVASVLESWPQSIFIIVIPWLRLRHCWVVRGAGLFGVTETNWGQFWESLVEMWLLQPPPLPTGPARKQPPIRPCVCLHVEGLAWDAAQHCEGEGRDTANGMPHILLMASCRREYLVTHTHTQTGTCVIYICDARKQFTRSGVSVFPSSSCDFHRTALPHSRAAHTLVSLNTRFRSTDFIKMGCWLWFGKTKGQKY